VRIEGMAVRYKMSAPLGRKEIQSLNLSHARRAVS
jgi:hypothetical protein